MQILSQGNPNVFLLLISSAIRQLSSHQELMELFSSVSLCLLLHKQCLKSLPQFFTAFFFWICFKKQANKISQFQRTKGEFPRCNYFSLQWGANKELISFISTEIDLHRCRQWSSDTPPAPKTRIIPRRLSYEGQHIIPRPHLSLLSEARHSWEIGKYLSPLHRTTEEQRLSIRLLMEMSLLALKTSDP